MAPTDHAPSDKAQNPHSVDRKLLERLICPVCHGPLEYDKDGNRLISRKAGLAYPIRGGIPILLTGEAEQLPDAQ